MLRNFIVLLGIGTRTLSAGNVFAADLEMFPDEVLMEVLGYLKAGDLKNLRLVSSTFARVGIEELLKKNRVQITREILHELLPYGQFVRRAVLAGFDDASVSWIRSFTNLVELDLSHNTVSNVKVVKHFPKLRKLNLAFTKVRDLRPLEDLVRLESLNLQESEVCDLSPLSKLESLKELNLFNTKVHEIAPIQHLFALERLYLSSLPLRNQAILPIQNLMNLRELHLHLAWVSDLTPLAGLTCLEKLCLSLPSVRDMTPLSALTQLEELYLFLPNVADLSPLQSLPRLKILHLANNEIREAEAMGLRRHLPDLTVNYCSPLYSFCPHRTCLVHRR